MGSMLHRPYFNDLFLTWSSAHPRLLFAVQGDDEYLFFSTPQPQNPYGKSSLVVAADFHIKFRADAYPGIYTSGLIFFPEMCFSKDYNDSVRVICNPITGHYAILPKLTRYRKWHSFFGFDPIDNQFKVLFMAYPWGPDDHRILTLGTGIMTWREIQFPGLPHWPCNKGICINGVLYYIGDVDETDAVIVCFDVRSEKFKLVNFPLEYTELINYKGKLGGISLKTFYDSGMMIHKLRMWLLEDVEKPKWSKYVYTLPENEVINSCSLSIAGVTASGEIFLLKENSHKPFYVFYFIPERNTLLSVEIQALEKFDKVYAFVDHVEDLNVNDAQQLKSSRVEQGLHIIRKSPKPQPSPDFSKSAPPVQHWLSSSNSDRSWRRN